MRHDLRLATSRSVISLLKPSLSLNRPSVLISGTSFACLNLFKRWNRWKNKESHTRSPVKNQVPPSTSGIVDTKSTVQPQSSSSADVKVTASPAQEIQELSRAAPHNGSGNVKESPKPVNSLPNLTSRVENTSKRPSIGSRPTTKGSNSPKVKQEADEEKRKASKPKNGDWTERDPDFPEKTWTVLDPAYEREHYLVRSSSDSRMRSYIQFITTPTSDTPGTALLLLFEDKRYIIGNAHEGLQRACLQVGAGVFRSKDIFLTGKTDWQSTGGLLGMILSLADAAKASAASKAGVDRLKRENKRKRGEEVGPSAKKDSGAELNARKEESTMRVHGGPNLNHTLAAARSFIFRKAAAVKIFEHTSDKEATSDEERDWEPTWSDNRIQVWAMPIDPSGVCELEEHPKIDSPLKRILMTGKRPSQGDNLDQWMSPEGQEIRNHQIRALAVSEMFSSAWSPHDLVEIPLREVKIAAAIYVRDDVTKELTLYQGPTPGGTRPVPDIDVLIRRPWPGALIDHLPATKRSSTAVSYIIRNQKMRGKFLPYAAKERKVPQGPLWAALASGSSVQSSDGITITPDMVLEPSQEGSGVAVIDLPSCEYVQSLVNRPEWKAEKVMSGVKAIIWILGPGVIQDGTLLKFIEGRPELQQVVSSPECCPNYLAITTAASMAIRHNQVDPIRYAVPVHSNAVPSTSGNSTAESLLHICQPAKRGLQLQLAPKFVISEEAVVPFLNTALVLQENSQDVLKLSQAARQDIDSPATQAEVLRQCLPSSNAEIICIGTGSAMPSQYRNVSATLLRVPDCGSYLMDCGENTLGQLKRMYTPPQLAEILQDLKLIWISHLHADHHLGLIAVIKAWYEEVHGRNIVKRQRPTILEDISDPEKLLKDGPRLFVVGHFKLRQWLEEYSSVEDFGFDQVIPLASYPVGYGGNASPKACVLDFDGTNVGFSGHADTRIKSAIRTATGLSDLATCWVSHCFGSQAVTLTFNSGFKFSYSGDCRPSKTFAQIGKGSTVLLHEATFDDDLKQDAKAKKHSTTSEAIGVGVAMGARRVILTHFSQRYIKSASTSALDFGSVRLEDTEDVDDPSAGMDQPVDEITSSVNDPVTIDELPESLDELLPQAQAESQPQKQRSQPIAVPGLTSTPPINAPAETAPSNDVPTPRPPFNDMKIGVAFDHMRVKVRDIMHLEKFTPALQEMYKDNAAEATLDSKAADEAFLEDDEKIALKKKHQGDKAKKGQIKAARKKQESQERWAKAMKEGKNKNGSRERAMEETEMIEKEVAEKMSAVE